MKVLITGATGNIGREVCAKLGKEHELICTSRREPSDKCGYKHYKVDMERPEGLAEIVAMQRPQVIIHLAAMLGGVCEQMPELAQKVNVESTRVLAEAAAASRVETFVFTSTAAVYNQKELAPTREDQNVDPQSIYGKTKLSAEAELAKIASRSQTSFVAMRVFNVFGPTLTGSLVYKLAHSTADAPVSLFGDDAFYRDYISMMDVVNALTSLNKLNELNGYNVMNISSGVATNNTKLIEDLRSQGYDPQFTVQEASPSYSWADISKARELIGFTPNPEIKL